MDARQRSISQPICDFAVLIEHLDPSAAGILCVETETLLSPGIDNFQAMNGEVVHRIPGRHQPDERSSERERKKDTGNDQEAQEADFVGEIIHGEGD